MNEQKFSFQTWLLSERTIKLVLYSGAFLLVLAGLIYAREQIFSLSGWQQLGLTMGATALVYAGGLTLLRRSHSLRVGGLALLGVAAGFAPINFAFLYLFDIIEQMNPVVVWLVASLICGLFYGATLKIARTSMMTWFTTMALLSAYAAVLTLLPIPFSICMILLSIPPFLLTHLSKKWGEIAWIGRPLFTIAHLSTPLLWLINSGALLHNTVGNPFEWIYQPDQLDPWFLIIASLMTIAFYLSNDWQHSSKWEQWLSVSMVTGSLVLTTFQLPLSVTLTMAVLMLIGVGYLLIAWKIEPTAGKIIPLYIFGYLLVSIVNLLTWSDLMASGEVSLDAAIVTMANVVIFLIAALIHGHQIFNIIAMGLFPLAHAMFYPFVPEDIGLMQYNIDTLSLAWGATSLLYMVLGNALRKQIDTDNKPLSTALFIISTLLIICVSIRTGLFAKIIVNRWAISAILLGSSTVAYGYIWKKRNHPRTTSDIFLIILAMGLSIGGILFASPRQWVTPELCLLIGLLYVAIGALLRGGFGRKVSKTFMIVGSFFALISTVGIDDIFQYLTWTRIGIVSLVFGALLIAKGWQKQRVVMIYLGVACILIGLFALMGDQGWIQHEQMVIIPTGIVMLAIGWHERKLDRLPNYQLLTFSALLIMFGTSFPSALNEGDGIWLSLLLIVECVLAFIWGVINRSRNFIRLSVTTLLAYALLQFYLVATSVHLFIKIGAVGALLLSAGIGLLLYRERLLQGHTEWQQIWKNEWKP